jgi:Virulence-associated protein E/Bifunctional DNA primase/polymerase, N-terminal
VNTSTNTLNTATLDLPVTCTALPENQCDSLTFALRNAFALFPCIAGTKQPAIKWKQGSSKDPAQWAAWLAEGFNLAINAADSDVFLLDIDSSKVGEDRAWTEHRKLCTSWGLPVLYPFCRTARGGWHVAVKRPAGFDAEAFKGWYRLVSDDNGKEIIAVKNRGLTIAPGSRFNGLPYYFLKDDPGPHPCPNALLAAIPATGAKPVRTSGLAPDDGARRGHGWDPELAKAYVRECRKYSDRDPADTQWQAAYSAKNPNATDLEPESLESEQTWTCLFGFAIGHEFGNAVGRPIFDLCSYDPEEKTDAEWANCCKVYAKPVTFDSVLKWGSKRGIKAEMSRPAATMFAGVTSPPLMPGVVAGIAAAVGASLHGGGAIALAGRGETIAELGRPIVDTFVSTLPDYPAPDAPTLPPECRDIPLHDVMDPAIARLLGNAYRAPKAFRTVASADFLGVLHRVHQGIYDATRLRAAGCTIADDRLSAAVRRFEVAVERSRRTAAGFICDPKGLPEHGNSDNVTAFCLIEGVEFRRNTWTNRDETKRRGEDWVTLADHHLDELITTAANSHYNFRPNPTMFQRSVRTREAPYDPVLIKLAELEAQWDGVPRIETWLHHTCHTPLDDYHRAASRSVIGGMVKRARNPGTKHDEMMILVGPEDTFKSTLARRLAFNNAAWFTDSVTCDGGDMNVIPQLFGRLVIELAEINMSKRDVQFWKRFLSTQSDNVALKHVRLAEDFPRRCIFVGTSNEDQPLLSDTGNRRSLIVRVERKIDLVWFDANFAQLVGEACALEAKGELFLIPEKVKPRAREIQAAATVQSVADVLLDDWFLDQPTNTFITSADLQEALSLSKQGHIRGGVAQAMKRLGYRNCEARIPGLGKKRGWFKAPVWTGERPVIIGNTLTRLQPAQKIAGFGPVEMRMRGLWGVSSENDVRH